MNIQKVLEENLKAEGEETVTFLNREICDYRFNKLAIKMKHINSKHTESV